MKIDWSFPRQILITLVVVAGAGAYPLVKFGDREITMAAIAGAILTTINVLLGFGAIEYSFDKSATTFFKYVLGGMGLRMFVMAGILVLLIKVFSFHIAALITSMGIFYAVYLTLEIIYIQNKIQRRQEH